MAFCGNLRGLYSEMQGPMDFSPLTKLKVLGLEIPKHCSDFSYPHWRSIQSVRKIGEKREFYTILQGVLGARGAENHFFEVGGRNVFWGLV